MIYDAALVATLTELRRHGVHVWHGHVSSELGWWWKRRGLSNGPFPSSQMACRDAFSLIH